MNSTSSTLVMVTEAASVECRIRARKSPAPPIVAQPEFLVHCRAPVSFFTPYLMAFNASACSRSARRNSRNSARHPPLSAFRETVALPSGDLGPVDFSHGRQFRISAACRSRRAGVHVVAMLCLQ